MKLVTIDTSGCPRTGALIDDDILDFTLAAAIVPNAGLIPQAMTTLLASGDEGIDLARRLFDTVKRDRNDEAARLRKAGALKSVKDVRLLAPNPRPGIVLSHGRAYHSHLKEMAKGEEKPRVTDEPRAFLKNVSAVTGPDSPIVLPRRFPDMVDFEGEFSVVFGRNCYDVEERDALACVAGYTIINDVSARDWVEHFVETNDPDFNRQGKQFPTFCPIGPVIATRDEVPDPHDVNLTTTLNDKVMQSAHTSDLIWTVGYLISYFSRWYHFRPGDILTTGSPAGVGYARDPKVFMKPGDVIAITVDRVGTLSNPVVGASG